jgi:hypothetical protein
MSRQVYNLAGYPAYETSSPSRTDQLLSSPRSAAMRTNIERAINDLILSDKDITLANALPAYLREAGFKKMTVDALVAFEHALDKYPTRPDASRAVFVKGISGITTEYWASKYNALANIPCSYCDTYACRLFNLRAEAEARVYGHPEKEKEKRAPKRRRRSLSTTILMEFVDLGNPLVKSKKKGRRVRAKQDIVTARVDPSAPSTSAVML